MSVCTLHPTLGCILLIETSQQTAKNMSAADEGPTAIYRQSNSETFSRLYHHHNVISKSILFGLCYSIGNLLSKFSNTERRLAPNPMDLGIFAILTLPMAAPTCAELAETTRISFRECVWGYTLSLPTNVTGHLNALGILLRYVSHAGRIHWKAVLRILRYLDSTQGRRLIIGPRNTRCQHSQRLLYYTTLSAHAHADWGGGADRASINVGPKLAFLPRFPGNSTWEGASNNNGSG